MTTNHSPTPWRIEVIDPETKYPQYCVIGSDGKEVFENFSDSEPPPRYSDAVFIVRSVNERQMLIDALEHYARDEDNRCDFARTPALKGTSVAAKALAKAGTP